MQTHAYSAGAMAVNDDILGWPIEVFDVFLYPVKGSDLIEHAIITGRLSVCRREESQDV